MNYTTTELQHDQEMNHIMKVCIYDRTYSTWEYTHPEKKKPTQTFHIQKILNVQKNYLLPWKKNGSTKIS